MSAVERSTDRVVVTGGAGFIGSHLCRQLRARGLEVTVLDDLSTGAMENLAGVDVEFVQGSILDASLLKEVCRRATSIAHLAARPSVALSLIDPAATHEVNVTGTLRVLEVARTCHARVVVASSASVYGANSEQPKRESTAPSPISPYAVSKLAAEGYALSYSRCFSLPVLVFRFFNVFGPFQSAAHPYAAVVPKFIDAALTGRPLQIHGDGLQTRDFTYAGTVAEVLADAIGRSVTYDGAVNLAFGSRINLLQLINRLEAVIGTTLAIEHVDSRSGDVRDSQADVTLLRSLFPHATPTGLTEGLAATVDWYKAGGLMSRPMPAVAPPPNTDPS